MVIVVDGNKRVDIKHIYYIQAEQGPILIGVSRAPKALMASLQIANYQTLNLLASRPGEEADLRATRDMLAPHNIRGDWFSPSPEVLEHADGRAVVAAGDGARPHKGGPRLTEAEVLDAFRLCHDSPMTQYTIGLRYGISTVSVGKIARGAVYKHLFRVTPVEGMVNGVPLTAGDFYVSENRTEAPRYRMTPGKRGVR